MSGSNPRHLAVRVATERQPIPCDRPVDGDGNFLAVREYFGGNTFGQDQMRAHLPDEMFKRFCQTIDDDKQLDRDLADAIARAALDWALSKGVSHFCHWFQPMTGATAEKHDAFIAFDGDRPVSQFTGSQLIQSEPDASSFPSGGMRSTFEARGYTAWDPTSPMFIIERVNGSTLCIPSVFVSYHGDALDKKAPLLRSMQSIGRQAVRLCHLLGDSDVRKVHVTAGPEQEYFLVDRAYAALRPDLMIAGRTVLGAPAPKGQTLDDHYFGTIPRRVLAFMNEVEVELYRLGVPVKTRHNEVAPSQFEVAVLYGQANIAADHNQLVIEMIKKVAERHDFLALLHEKPFAGVNGSGKHLNWSLADDHGRNMLEPGDNPHSNLRFLAFLAATLLGVHRHAALLRSAIASHGNDFRLGANEAPPAIISAFLGEQLTRICDTLAAGEEPSAQQSDDTIELNMGAMPLLDRDQTDRNRTSPFAFTGNKFEFRAVGSNSSISWPLTCLNLAVTDGLAELCDRIEKRWDGEASVLEIVREVIRETRDICFEGNNYAEEWVQEAARRGLPNLRRAPEALAWLQAPSTIDLFERHEVLKPAELDSRFNILVEHYITSVDIEVDVMRDMIAHSVLPAAIAERTAVAGDIAALRAAAPDLFVEADLVPLKALTGLIGKLRAASAAMEAATEGCGDLEGLARAGEYARSVLPALEQVRAAADALEARISDGRWSLPRYREMLFQN